MGHPEHHRRAAIRGQAMVEFALGAALFFFLVIGILQFSMLYHYKLVIGNASREGVRYAAVHGARDPMTDDEIKDWVIAQAVGLNPPLARADITIEPPKELREPAEVTRLAISYRVPASSALIPSVIGRDIELSAESRMRLE